MTHEVKKKGRATFPILNSPKRGSPGPAFPKFWLPEWRCLWLPVPALCLCVSGSYLRVHGGIGLPCPQPLPTHSYLVAPAPKPGASTNEEPELWIQTLCQEKDFVLCK